MFKKQHRLSKKTILKEPLIYETLFFKLKVSRNGLLNNRYGFTVSTKVDKKAVVRNRTKRRFRACLEKINYNLKQGYDLIFVLKKEAVQETTKSLCLKMTHLLKEKALLK